MANAEDVSENVSDNESSQVKKRKPGILYLSTLPPYMNVTKANEIFSCYGEVGRIFLQPAPNERNKKKPAIHFSEGWIEFKRKRIAKLVAMKLNNSQIGGKKRSKFYDYIWNIKYLPRFKWAHLGERLAYERAVRRQRLRTEIAQVKREANNFSEAVDKKKKRIPKTAPIITNVNLKQPKESDNPSDASDRTEFLKSLFS